MKTAAGVTVEAQHEETAAAICRAADRAEQSPWDMEGAISKALADAEWKGASEMLARIRVSLEFWQQEGCDSVVAQMVKRIEDAAWARGCSSGTSHPWVESMGR